jgi:hypothetical protein
VLNESVELALRLGTDEPGAAAARPEEMECSGESAPIFAECEIDRREREFVLAQCHTDAERAYLKQSLANLLTSSRLGWRSGRHSVRLPADPSHPRAPAPPMALVGSARSCVATPTRAAREADSNRGRCEERWGNDCARRRSGPAWLRQERSERRGSSWAAVPSSPIGRGC